MVVYLLRVGMCYCVTSFGCQYSVSFSCRATIVHVSIGDVNDNDPQFSENEYNFTISESAGIGTMSTILVGAVTDIDDGPNADYTFSLSDTSEPSKTYCS